MISDASMTDVMAFAEANPTPLTIADKNALLARALKTSGKVHYFEDTLAIIDATRKQERTIQQIAGELVMGKVAWRNGKLTLTQVITEAINAPAADRAECLGLALHLWDERGMR